MLQKFLFIGIGGSGGKTLRLLHHDLSVRLSEAGYHGGLPAAWQFLHVDVPVTPDGTASGLPPQLPTGRYAGLAPRGLAYRDLDGLLAQKGRHVSEHTAGWRPDAHAVSLSPTFGAGQYRAVGRTIAGAALGRVVQPLTDCVRALSDVAVDQELAEVARVVAGAPGVSPHAPQVVVVSSIAGGSGSGMFLDVCDTVRQLMPRSKDQIAALLYTPDVFSALPPASRGGVNANALAAVSELLASFWNSEPPRDDEFAFLGSAGVAVTNLERRGPSQTFLFGASNGDVNFTSQVDVYRAAARALTAWTTDRDVQDLVHTSVVGNYATKGKRVVDRTGLAPGREAPLSAMGYASLDLGRGRFGSYVSQRLARKAAHRLLKGHWNERVPQEETPEAACHREAKQNHLDRFLEECGLRKRGQGHAAVLDALRGGSRTARAERWRALRQRIEDAVVEGTPELDVSTARQRIESRITEEWQRVLDDEREGDEQRARDWHVAIQERLADRTADLLGRIGAPVTAEVLELTVAEITASVIPELQQIIDSERRLVGSMRQRLRSAFASFDGQIRSDNPLLRSGIDEGLQTIDAEAEARLYELAARLLGDLAQHCLEPLRQAVVRSTQRLQDQHDGAPGRPSRIQDWPVEAPPRAFEPAQNELLLEPVAGYPKRFTEVLRATTGVKDSEGALLQAVREIITGVSGSDAESVVGIIRRWVPSQQVLPTTGTTTNAHFNVRLDTDELLRRAERWVNRRDTAVGQCVHESLDGYLGGSGVEPVEHQRRLDAFQAAFRQALLTSKPLVDIDDVAYTHFHGPIASEHELHNIVMTPLPFPRSHPAGDVVRQVLHWKSDAELDALFTDRPSQRIEITTFLDAPAQPPVFRSLVGPIAGQWAAQRMQRNLGGFWQWRRARPLSEFLPVSPDARRMLIRGWFVGRLLNRVQIEDPRQQPVTITDGERPRSPFPFPLLGGPIRSLADVLPAVLESLPVAMVVNPQEALRAYSCLHALGAADDAWGSALHPDLEAWIGDGRIAAGAPAPKDIGGESRSERAAAVLGVLERYVDFYEDLDSVDVTRNGRPLARSWELRHEIVQQLTDLQRLVEKARFDVDFSTGVG